MKETGGRFEGAMRTKCLAVVLNAVAIGLSVTVGATDQAALETAHAIPRLTLEEFRVRQAAGSVLVVDVRDEFVFKAGHIPGAMSVPLAEIDRRAGEVRTRAGQRPVVTYCSCPSEQTAASAAMSLSKLGIANVSVLVGGYPEWVATGGAVERGEG
ncbi:MAG TPA: rhodanese-like domain-containing protein [Vicinamibacterales bacterium]|nr:rhodanese-like domain-containing protein [Vicinamibacterales bacterium]